MAKPFLLPVFVHLSILLIASPAAQAQLQDDIGQRDKFWKVTARPGLSVTLCHIPPGNPDNARTIVVGEGAVSAHLGHGDTLGECPEECSAYPSPVGVEVDPRFTDNGDGTVTDNLTGLIWLRDASCLLAHTRLGAVQFSTYFADGSCGLTDGSMVGDWRPPSVKELHSLIDYEHADPALPEGHPFSEVSSSCYWSSTGPSYPPDDLDLNAWWVVYFGSPDGYGEEIGGQVQLISLGYQHCTQLDCFWVDTRCAVWPVRG